MGVREWNWAGGGAQRSCEGIKLMDRHVYKSVTEANRESVLCLHVCLPDFSSLYTYIHKMRERIEKQREREWMCVVLWMIVAFFGQRSWRQLPQLPDTLPIPTLYSSFSFLSFSTLLPYFSPLLFPPFLILKKTKITLYYSPYGYATLSLMSSYSRISHFLLSTIKGP